MVEMRLVIVAQRVRELCESDWIFFHALHGEVDAGQPGKSFIAHSQSFCYETLEVAFGISDFFSRSADRGLAADMLQNGRKGPGIAGHFR